MQSPAAMRGAPQWLRSLLSEEFFDACGVHAAERKSDKNHFCVDCVAALCRHCLPHDASHDILQSHMVSEHEVVFLNERTARKRSTSTENPCVACARPLPFRHDYCSLFCKVKHLGESEQGLRRVLRGSGRKAAATGGEDSVLAEALLVRKRRASLPESGWSCCGSLRKSRKQAVPNRSPY
ncbi:protein RGF1 INDUCIBLE TRANSCRIPTION FACTOR 1-like isoform X2 [Oryza brachyantha]|uniref:protein RGF1 INDUCIBLE TRANSCRIPTION FACTOR 1-like isoform X2 n=1 Tax=Oryza brachyantha TaxID=4533 RepID=UPI0007763037|nr:protein RGF1 INDUCIBLE TRANSCRIPTION FACTOR 1-like isoform X2 [Oryza brachyantha]